MATGRTALKPLVATVTQLVKAPQQRGFGADEIQLVVHKVLLLLYRGSV